MFKKRVTQLQNSKNMIIPTFIAVTLAKKTKLQKSYNSYKKSYNSYKRHKKRKITPKKRNFYVWRWLNAKINDGVTAIRVPLPTFK